MLHLQRSLTRGVRWTAALLLAAGATLATPSLATAADDGGIQVTGIGEVSVVPDMARLSLEVRREGTDAAALKAELDAVTGRVLAFTESLDIARRDVTAATVNLYPRYQSRDDEQIPAGLIASRSIEVTVRDLSRIGELINGALERGVNGVGGVQLDAANRVELERKALDLAIDDALREARQMAERFKVGLGALVSASSSSHQAQPLMMMDVRAARGAAKESFAPGEMSIRRDVQARFAIRP